ncbi:MAG TPA: chemotaxis protein CheW [Leptospiraceae bacterium]|nr:chemotaxis protein CheW [Leptospiraceae bacterium]HMW04882.1 chemotaxis protein CheW [Leptospiraceae bacterium]HMX32565.1 chemotaxis protein CheW [Leptospiraceae bacterium]HMY30897.1 chemotaxis protein CheW [Leptospiraceae bacterium]HMZ62701.1 chemotaxis protein CheW [Leptospiraceae bacterium]
MSTELTTTNLELESLSENKNFIFLFGAAYFSIQLTSVVEVYDSPEIKNLPWQELGLKGMIEYRGIPVPVLDPLAIANITSDRGNKPIKTVVIFEKENCKIALAVDKFHNIIPEPENESEDFQEDSFESFIIGFSMLSEKPLVYLNEEKIVKHYKKIFTRQVSLKSNQKQEIFSTEKKQILEKFIFFTIGEVNFGVPIREVLEVLENLDVTPLFKVVPTLRGLINLRGKVVPCMDISGYLGLPARSLNENTKFVLLQSGGSEIALCVDSVSKMKEIDNALIQNNEGILNGPISEYATGVLQLQKQTLLMISAKNLIESNDLKEYFLPEAE